MHIEQWPIDKPIDYPKNARVWSKQAIAKVADSIRAYGFRQPIVVDKHGVICIGHLRRTAARTLGLLEVPVHVASDLTAAQIRGLRLMDNRSAQEATFDLEALGAEFLELKALDFDLSLTGFNIREIDSFTLQPNPAEDDVPPVPEAPVSQLGDLWLLGDHRLLCGDSTKAEDVARLIPPFSICFTSPPYNAGAYTLTGNVKKKDKSSRYTGQSDNRSESDYLSLLCQFTKIAMESCEVVAVNIQQLAGNKFAVLRWVNEFMEHFVDRAIWYKGKGNPAMAPSVMASRFEDIWIFSPSLRPSRSIKTAECFECVRVGWSIKRER